MVLLSPQTDRTLPDANVPLVVDLDDTLLRTDLTLESLCVLARCDPLRLLEIPKWLAGGLAHFKKCLNEIAMPDARTLPYREDLLAWLRDQRLQGRSLVVAARADEKLAREIAEDSRLFDRVIASDGVTYLDGETKRKRLVAEFGDRHFDYVGSHRRDLPVWSSAREALLVSPSARLAREVAEVTPVAKVFDAQPTTVGAVLHEMRVHHWIKNLLIFVPAAAAHRLFPLDWLGRAVLAFGAFSLCASSIYVLNDLLDLTHDREHPEKKDRMVASGQIRPAVALEMLMLLVLGAVAFSVRLPAAFSVVLWTYFLLMVAYSLRLKEVPILDVAILSAGYALRVMAGAAATGIELSVWVPAFIALLFCSFTLIKRCGELQRQVSLRGAGSVQLYGYLGSDTTVLMIEGVTSGYLAVVVLAVYTNSDVAQRLFPRHELFWGLCALLFYWISYMWLVVARGRMHHDPVVFALADPASRWLLMAMAAVTLVSL